MRRSAAPPHVYTPLSQPFSIKKKKKQNNNNNNNNDNNVFSTTTAVVFAQLAETFIAVPPGPTDRYRISFDVQRISTRNKRLNTVYSQ